MKSGNACCHSLHNILSSSFLSKNIKIKTYKTISLPVVLSGCKTWSLTLREEHRLKVSENRVLWKVFGSKKDKVTGAWRKLHNDELHDLYSSPMRACSGELVKVLCYKSEGHRYDFELCHSSFSWT